MITRQIKRLASWILRDEIKDLRDRIMYQNDLMGAIAHESHWTGVLRSAGSYRRSMAKIHAAATNYSYAGGTDYDAIEMFAGQDNHRRYGYVRLHGVEE